MNLVIVLEKGGIGIDLAPEPLANDKLRLVQIEIGMERRAF